VMLLPFMFTFSTLSFKRIWYLIMALCAIAYTSQGSIGLRYD